MSYNHQRVSKDANHDEIVDALRKHGVDVIDLAGMGDGVSDIITHYRGKTVFIEIKCGPKAELKKKQVRFLAMWSGYSGIARNVDEALALATDPINSALSDSEKNIFAQYYATMTAKKVHLATIDKLLV